MASKELWFVAEGEDGRTYRVSKKGRSIYISGPDGREHLCHPSAKNQSDVKSEILLVFRAKVINIK